MLLPSSSRDPFGIRSILIGTATEGGNERREREDNLLRAATVRERVMDRWRHNPLADARGSDFSACVQKTIGLGTGPRSLNIAARVSPKHTRRCTAPAVRCLTTG